MEEDQQPPGQGVDMTGLLTAAAVVTTIVLLVSATNTTSRATASDQHKRGTWGIAHWTSVRNRPLNPHQRRWHTALVYGRDIDGRWLDLVAEIQALEELSATTGITPVPKKHDRQWVEASIANLEATIPTTDPGDPAQ